MDPRDACGLTCIHFLSNVGYDSNSLDVSDDIGFRIKHNKIEGPIDLMDDNVSPNILIYNLLKR